MSKFNIIPIYQDMLWCKTPEQQQQVGYFEDCFSIDEHQNILPYICSQIDPIINMKINNNVNTTMHNVLLVFFGCFAPFHEGHMNAITLSKKHFISRGFNVLGCVLFQSHDDYILTKKHITPTNIRKFSDLNKRYLNDKQVYVDTFSNLLRGELNFPYLLLRCLSYIKEYKNTKLGVIVGEDNRGFSFIEHDKIEFSVISRSDPLLNDKYDISSTKYRETKNDY